MSDPNLVQIFLQATSVLLQAIQTGIVCAKAFSAGQERREEFFRDTIQQMFTQAEKVVDGYRAMLLRAENGRKTIGSLKKTSKALEEIRASYLSQREALTAAALEFRAAPGIDEDSRAFMREILGLFHIAFDEPKSQCSRGRLLLELMQGVIRERIRPEAYLQSIASQRLSLENQWQRVCRQHAKIVATTCVAK